MNFTPFLDRFERGGAADDMVHRHSAIELKTFFMNTSTGSLLVCGFKIQIHFPILPSFLLQSIWKSTSPPYSFYKRKARHKKPFYENLTRTFATNVTKFRSLNALQTLSFSGFTRPMNKNPWRPSFSSIPKKHQSQLRMQMRMKNGNKSSHRSKATSKIRPFHIKIPHWSGNP